MPQARCDVATLVLTLTGPMQSWGTQEGGHLRGTDSAPSKSGVAGLIGSALGRSRFESLSDIVDLPFAVRIDVPGTVVTDFHTMQRVNEYNGKTPLPEMCFGGRGYSRTTDAGATMHRRSYLVDAVFVVALTGDAEFLTEIASAVRRPVYPLFLGRRSCPAEPVDPHITEHDDPVDALKEYPFQGLAPVRRAYSNDEGVSVPKLRDGSWGVPDNLAVQRECSFGVVGSRERRDVPSVRSGWGRTFNTRAYETVYITTPVEGDSPQTDDTPIGF